VTAEPRVVLGMTLYNNAQHLPRAMKSILTQTYPDFVLCALDDASTDDTGDVVRGYLDRDLRLRYRRHSSRQAMIATWREVVHMAAHECPSAEYFAWVSDHDVWHPRWLERLVGELDSDPGAVLAYPVTRRLLPDGSDIDKGPRLFDTSAYENVHDRWKSFCLSVGAGDMVYGLIRLDALRCAGTFRTVLRPDRLLIAELTLRGRIRQVPEVLWSRRQSNSTSVERQRTTLLPQGATPRWFFWAPWLQHAVVLWREYAAPDPRPLPLTRREWVGMLLRYQITYVWKGFRKTDVSHTVERTAGGVWWARKLVKHYCRHAVYNALVGGRVLWGRLRRAAKRVLYEALMLTHRLGIRGRGDTP
jgi:glycosyltransferase involved in cell wall biosynthesis